MLLNYKPTAKAKTKSLPTIAVDFDGVICIPTTGKKMGIPNIGAKDSLNELSERFKIVIFTLRAHNKEHVAEWLEYYDIPYHEITDIKPDALAYIDDKAIRHISWPENMRLIEAYLGVYDG